MSVKLVNIGSVIGKEILNLEDGAFLGRVQGINVDASEAKVIGIQIKQKGILGGKNIIPFESIKAFGSHTVTVSHLEGVMSSEGRNILGMPVISVDGTILGKIMDYAFVPESGLIAEYVLKGGLMKDVLDDKGIVEAGKILSIGKDVVIAMEDIDNTDFKAPTEDVYGDWKEIDDIIAELNDDELFDLDDETDKRYEEQFDDLTNKINKTIGDVTTMIKKEVNTEELAGIIKEQADRIGGEARGFFDSMKDKLQQNKVDTDTLKQEFKNKVNSNKASKKEDNEDTLANQIVEQLKGSSVEKPLLDAEGNVIVWPGQVIGSEEVKQAIKAGKLQELIGLTSKVVADDEIVVEEAGVTTEQVEESTQADQVPDDQSK